MEKLSVLIINGPNLNLLGTRQPEIYGSTTFTDYLDELKDLYSNTLELEYFQSNSEGELIDCIQKYSSSVSGIIINAGAYTHTSVAIHDALANISIPKVEVHISNIHKREVFRHHSYLSPVCDGIIIGMGLKGYRLALEFILQK
ncbi:type II 3-dehydroquinate dehydratase [Membranihabitans maritimus]|uniref:type II 3-dehydroquinate dehydratase n=1 Tax=Membranihabitans maritimus TaxID=2904244 RepID=UPI001F02E4F6|nr:type II 3-dehydroquinate dehydratase [Membranihabitans maritimus]